MARDEARTVTTSLGPTTIEMPRARLHGGKARLYPSTKAGCEVAFEDGRGLLARLKLRRR